MLNEPEIFSRNPLHDPWPGDVVRSRFTRELFRRVTASKGGRVFFTWQTATHVVPGEQSLDINTWRERLHGGAVIKASPERKRPTKEKKK